MSIFRYLEMYMYNCLFSCQTPKKIKARRTLAGRLFLSVDWKNVPERLASGLITLVNDNHVDNYLKEILAFFFFFFFFFLLWLDCKQSTQRGKWVYNYYKNYDIS